MNQKHVKGLMKHGDFIIMDLLCLQTCFVLSYWITERFGNPYVVSCYEVLCLMGRYTPKES